MDIEKILEFVDELVFSRKGQHLSDLQILLFRACWCDSRQSYENIAQTYDYSANYFKQDVGPKLWRLLSDVCEEKVTKTNFRSTIERKFEQTINLSKAIEELEKLTVGSFATNLSPTKDNSFNHSLKTHQVKIPSDRIYLQTRQDWGEAPDVSIFYNRTQEIALLEEWIVIDKCRLVALVGMGGMGKTHLAVKLAKNIQAEFDCVIWRSLANAPPLQQLLNNLLHFLTKGKDVDLPVSMDEQISALINYLRKRQCLLILDNLETILCDRMNTGHYKQGYEGYGELFKLIGECSHQSCLILTSREKPQEVALMQGETLPVRSLKLNGLNVEAAVQILQLKGCSWQSDSEYRSIVEKYSGNPLALKIVGAAILELFAGNISEFIKHNTLVFGEIYLLLEEQFNRLSDLGQTFLYWLAIEQEPVSVRQLQADILPIVGDRKILETLKSLAQRSLLEHKNNLFFLQPVVKEYLISRLIERVCREIVTGDLDIFNSHALLKAQSKEYIINAQVRFIIQPVIERLISIFKNQNNLEIKLKQIIANLRSQSNLQPGYAAGNILNILCQLQTDLNGYDFSHLTVWQAYLQDINLHNVNFAHADLTKSVFAEQLTNILSVAYSPDGLLLATGDSNGEIRLWRTTDCKPILICTGHAGWIYSVNFSPDGRTLCSGSSDQTVKLWNVADGKCLKTLSEHNQRVRFVVFSPDGKTLASGSSDRAIRLWDVETSECLKIFSGHTNYVWSVSFSPDGKILASGSEDKTVKLWDVNSGRCLKTLKEHSLWVRSVAFSPDGKILASGSGDRTVKIWDVNSGQCLHTLKGHTERVRSIAFSPDVKILASGAGDHTIRLWDVSAGRYLKTLHGHSNRLGAVAFSPVGLASAKGFSHILASAGEDRSVKLWEVDTGKCFKTWRGYASWIQSVAFSPNGNILASGSEDRLVKLWQLQDDRWVQNLTLQGHNGWVCSVSFSPDSRTLASASSDYSLKLWDTYTGECYTTLIGHTRWIRSIIFSPDGKKLVSGSGDYTVKLWHIDTESCLTTFRGHTGWIWSVAISYDGSIIASASEDKTVILWDIKTGKCLKILKGHNSWVQSVAFSPDGKTIASGSCDRTIKLWNLSNGQCYQTLRGHNSWVQSVAFSPDGKTIASGSCDRTIKLWDLSNGQCYQTLRGHNSWVWSVTFSPDGKTIASGSQDETIKLWEIDTSKCYSTLRNKRPLEGMNITNVKGLTEAQLVTLKALGAMSIDRHNMK